jgi:hypothetical protein
VRSWPGASRSSLASLPRQMRTKNQASSAWLGLLVLGASCAQGSTGDVSDFGALASDDAAGSSVGDGTDAGSSSLSGDAGGGGSPSGPSTDDAGETDVMGGGSSSGSVGSGSGTGASGSGSGGSGSGAGGSGSSSGSTSSSGGSGSSSGGSSSSSGGTTAPITCAEADQAVGCCVANTVYYCKTSASSITSKTCSSGEVCGWDSAESYYYCVTAPGGADPSGTYPQACD